MADVSEIITLGIGTPSTIPFFLTLGLGLPEPAVPPADTNIGPGAYFPPGSFPKPAYMQRQQRPQRPVWTRRERL